MDFKKKGDTSGKFSRTQKPFKEKTAIREQKRVVKMYKKNNPYIFYDAKVKSAYKGDGKKQDKVPVSTSASNLEKQKIREQATTDTNRTIQTELSEDTGRLTNNGSLKVGVDKTVREQLKAGSDKTVHEPFKADTVSTMQERFSPFTDGTVEEQFKTDTEMPVKTNDIEIKSNLSLEDEVNAIFEGHDKMASKETHVKAEHGGGATIKYKYTKAGKLKGQAKVDAKFVQRDKVQTLASAIQITNDAQKKLESFTETSNVIDNDGTTASSSIDEKVEKLFVNASKNSGDKKERLKKTWKQSKSDLKTLKKELKQESKSDKKKDTEVSDKESNDLIKLFRQPDENKNTEDNTVNVVHSKPIAKDQTQKKGETGKKDELSGFFVKDKSTNIKFADEKDGNLVADKNKKIDSVGFVPNIKSMSKTEQYEQKKAELKALKREKNKQLKKQASRAAVANFLDGKKNIKNELSDVDGINLTGDLIHDGSNGLIKTFSGMVKNMAGQSLRAVAKQLAKWTAMLIKAAAPMLLGILLPALISMLLLGGMMVVVGADGSGTDGVDITVEGDGNCYQSVSQEHVDRLINELYSTYGADMDETREEILRYAFSKVGCPYDQAYHGNLTEDIFDCSSYVYRSYLNSGYDISNGGIYTAAEICRAMDNAGKTISDGTLLPGDIIFYSYEENGRYKNISHVVIYVGKVTENGKLVDKAVEAYGTELGVVYNDCKSSKAISVARPLQ